MKSLAAFLLYTAITCWFAMAQPASAQEYECNAQTSYTPGGVLPVVDGRAFWCVPMNAPGPNDEGFEPISCDVTVDGGATVRYFDLEPGMVVATQLIADAFGEVDCSTICTTETRGGTRWTGLCGFPDGPLGIPGVPVRKQSAVGGP